MRSAVWRGYDLLVDLVASGTERRVLIEHRQVYKRSGGMLRSSWWLIARNGDGPLEVLTLDGGNTLPVFSGDGEAELFLWLREARERGWGLHESSAEELLFVLSGPCSHASEVVLDPSAEIFHAHVAEPLGREDFMEWIVSKDL